MLTSGNIVLLTVLRTEERYLAFVFSLLFTTWLDGMGRTTASNAATEFAFFVVVALVGIAQYEVPP